MIKIIHCADIHLDSPFSSSSIQKARLRRELLRGTFTTLMLYARTEKADIMLLPGDLFDSEFVSRQTASLMIQQFEQTPECRFVIAPGNHDPYRESSPYKHEKFPSNVYIFSSPLISKFSFDDINTDVYGFAFTSDAMEINPAVGKTPENPEKINILCCHADIAPSSKYCPITVNDIENSGFDYVALGHVHNSDGIHKAGDTYYGYSGCPEGRSYDECGKKSAVFIKAEKTAGVFRPEFTLKQLTQRRYEKSELDVTGVLNSGEILKKIENLIYENKYDEETSLRVVLRGEVDSDMIISTEALEKTEPGVGTLEIIDETMPLLDCSELESDPTVRGAFYAQLKPMLEDKDEEVRKTAAQALRLGLSALNKM